MSTRGVISSFACSSESRSTPSIISASATANSPFSAADSTTETSSASESARRSRASAGANTRDASEKALLNGSSAARQKRSASAQAGASASAWRSARHLGVISPKSSSSTVVTGTAAKPPQAGKALTKSR